jgi:hypothetical protein
MSVEPKKIKRYSTMLVVAVLCLLSAGYLFKKVRNKSDVANLMAIAGASGATVFTLEPSSALLTEIDTVASNPDEVAAVLERSLDAKVREHGEKRRLYSDPKSAIAMSEFENCFAYSIRILVLKRWKSGMSKKEIRDIYLANVKSLTSKYDFKNNTEAFLGFK